MSKPVIMLGAIILSLQLGCIGTKPSSTKTQQTNKTEHLKKPYVLLISLDGYRYDYLDRFMPKHLSSRVANGTKANSLIPCYPSKTFPNHYSIATGMTPEKHNLVSNEFYDAKKDQVYRIRDREKVLDGTWYGGTPIWVNAEKQGMLSASYFFVGSDANIQNTYPTYYKKYDGSIPNSTRTSTIINWLKKPAPERPHLLTLYFSDVDTKGHQVGPNDDIPLKESIDKVDRELGWLFAEIDKLNLPVNVIIVSDHGMLEIPTENLISVEKFEHDAYRTVSNGAFLHIYPHKPMNLDSLKVVLQQKSDHVKVHKTVGSPFYKNDQKNKRLGDILVLPDSAYYFSNYKKMALAKTMKIKRSGQHGFPVELKEMHGIFYAFGPNIKAGHTIDSFQNIHIYPLICKILGLDIPKEVEGDINVLKDILK